MTKTNMKNNYMPVKRQIKRLNKFQRSVKDYLGVKRLTKNSFKVKDTKPVRNSLKMKEQK